MFHPSSPIGVIDSGVGGFSVARQVRKLLPHEDLIYMGDGGNPMYGGRSEEEILTMTRHMLRFMEEREIKVLLVACNTISCLIPRFQEEMSCPVFSVVQAGGRAAAALPQVKKLAVLSTVFTARSGMYPRLIGRLAPEKQVISRPCPNLAALVELVVNDPGMRPLIETDLRDDLDDLVNEEQVDCCLLGCTHYPLVEDIIHSLYPDLFLLDPAFQMAETLKEYLERTGMNNRQEQPGRMDVFTTGSVTEYAQKAARVGLEPLTSVQYYPPLKLESVK